MKKPCLNCKTKFEPRQEKHFFCSTKCKKQYYSDRKPRKTSKSYKKAIELRNKHITQNEKEIIYGTLLGDACLILSKTNSFHRLSLCHAEKQKDYLQYKAKSLPSIFLNKEGSKYINGKNTQYHVHSIYHKDLTNIYGLLYRKKKFITRKFLNLVEPTSLLFWHVDDGSMIKSSGNSIILCTDSFSLSENKAISIWFWQKYRIKTNLLQVKGSFSDNIYYRQRLVKSETIKLLDIISTSIYFKDLVKICPNKFFPYY